MLNLLKDVFSSDDTPEIETPKPAPKKTPKKCNYPKTQRRWSQCEIDALPYLRDAGKGWAEIATYVDHPVGSTEQAFRIHHKKASAKKSPATSHHQRVIAALKSGANTQGAIADATNLFSPDIAKTLRDLIKSGRVESAGYVEGPTGRARKTYRIVA